MRKVNLIFLSFLVITCCSCRDDNDITRGFYYWKSDFALTEEQELFLNDIDAEYLYIKYFDVEKGYYDSYPSAELDFISKTDLEIVPTIYLTPNVFYNLSEWEINQLADNCASKIKAIHPAGKEFSEIQVDCDWTKDIQLAYFQFLETLQDNFQDEVVFSATVRLYQYKYPDINGVPPVDKGLLMYYNMGNLREYDQNNSILNNGIGEQFLGFGEYPLPIDLALPNFKWALLFRGGKFQYICPNFTKSQLNDKDLFSNTRNNWYIFKKDTVIDGNYFRFGDELRYEECSENQLLTAAKMLKNEINQEETRVLIYDLQPHTPKDYEKLDAVFSTFD